MKPRKLTAEKRAAIERRRVWHPPGEPTRVGSDLVIVARAEGSRVVFYEVGPGDDEALVGWFDVGAAITTGDVIAIDCDELLSIV